MKKILFILIPIILLTFSCTQSKNGGLVAGDTAYTEVRAFGGITSVTSSEEDQFKVCWNPIAGAREYRIFFGKPGGCGTLVDSYADIVTDPSISCKTVTLPQKKPGVTYTVSVRACDSYDNPDLNLKTMDITIADLTPPDFDGLINAIATGAPRQVMLQWKAATGDPYRYEIYYCKENPNVTVSGYKNSCPDDTTETAIIKSKFDTAFKGNKIERYADKLTINPSDRMISELFDELDGIGFGYEYHFLVKACDKAGNCSDSYIIKNKVYPARGGLLKFAGAKSATYDNQRLLIKWDEPQDAVDSFKVFVSLQNVALDQNSDYKQNLDLSINDYIGAIFSSSLNNKYPAQYSLSYPGVEISTSATYKVAVKACASGICSVIDPKQILSVLVTDNVPPKFLNNDSQINIADLGYGVTGATVSFRQADTNGVNDFSHYAIYKFSSCDSSLNFTDSNLVLKI